MTTAGRELGIKRWDEDRLHAVARHLRSTGYLAELSAAQEWLWGAVVKELERRNRRHLFKDRFHSCELCRIVGRVSE